jgi:predicted methyltransferase MtxX (methanogen marker protein 4)
VESTFKHVENDFPDEENLSVASTVNKNLVFDHDNIYAPFGIDSTKFSSVDKLIRTTALASRFMKKMVCENRSLTSFELECRKK